jgi:threonine/homoserine/homoserine lactone efflux protein
MWPELGLFAGAFAVSAALPGPDTLLLFARAVSSGARSAAQVAVGLTLGKLGLLTAAVAGVTAAAATPGPFFVALKLAGGAYLLWLAVRLLHRGTHDLTAQGSPARSRRTTTAAGRRGGVGLGALLTLSNPQALLFYVAVLPAVLNSQNVTGLQYLLLCVTLVLIMAAVAVGYISLALSTRTALSHRPRRRADQAGAMLLGATGVLIALR